MDERAKDSVFIEKRSKPRITCAYNGIVRGSTSAGKKIEEYGTVLNLSSSGIYVMINCCIEVGQCLAIKIAFPTGSLVWGTTKLVSDGIVVRTEALSEGCIGIGIKILHYHFL